MILFKDDIGAVERVIMMYISDGCVNFITKSDGSQYLDIRGLDEVSSWESRSLDGYDIGVDESGDIYFILAEVAPEELWKMIDDPVGLEGEIAKL